MQGYDAISGPVVAQTSGATLFSSAVAWSFALAIMCAPLFHGGNIPLAWGINAAVFGALLVALAGVAGLGGGLPHAWRKLGWIAIAASVVLIWALVQASGWTPSSWHHPAWQRLTGMAGPQPEGAMSADPGRTEIAALRLATTFAVFLCAAMLGQDRVWARRILIAVAVAGAVQAVAALLSFASTRQLSEVAASPVTGSFVNRNHFAIYLGLALVCGWSILLDMTRRALKGKHDVMDIGIRIRSAMIAGVLCILLAPTAIALLMTTSRAGIALSILALAIVIGLEFWRAGRRSGAIVLAMAALLSIALLFLLMAHGASLGQRLADGGLAADIEPRLNVARITLSAIADRPLAGHGYGTFPAVFASYRDGSLPLAAEWNEAHNVYLETLLELGVPAGALLIVAASAVFWRCLCGAVQRRRRQELPAAGAAALVLVGGHAVVDFSMQLQGIALTVAAITGVGFAQAWRTSARPSQRYLRHREPSPP